MTALLACPVAAAVVWLILAVGADLDARHRTDRHHNRQDHP